MRAGGEHHAECDLLRAYEQLSQSFRGSSLTLGYLLIEPEPLPYEEERLFEFTIGTSF